MFSVQPELVLESFIEEHDTLTWASGPSTSQTNNPITSLHTLQPFVNVTIINNFPSVERLWQHLSELDLLNSERLRPSWDSYFMVSLL
jgi:dCMP deaminase